MKPIKDDDVFTKAVKDFSSKLSRRLETEVTDGTLVKHEHGLNHVEYTLTGFDMRYKVPIKMVAHIKRDKYGQVKWYIEQNTQQTKRNPFEDVFRTGQP